MLFFSIYTKDIWTIRRQNFSQEEDIYMARRGENIYKRKDGRYEGRYIKKYSKEKKPVYGYVYDRTYLGVKKKLNKCKAESDVKPRHTDIILSDWILNWIDAKHGIKDSTRQLYERHINNHIIPALGKIKLKNLNTDILQVFINSLNLSASTVKLIFNILKSSLKNAEDSGIISNIWSKVKLPKLQKTDIQILTIKEQYELEKVLNSKNDIGILICLYTGLRIGELCSLRWRDIDFDNSLMHITGTQSRIDGKLVITTPKSKSSVRTIPIPDCLLKKLKECGKDNDFIISNNGNAVDIRTYRRQFKKKLIEAGLPDIKYHALRHTFSSRALEVGMDYKTLSEILGHASVSITMDIYVHSLDEHKKRQINKLNTLYKD